MRARPLFRSLLDLQRLAQLTTVLEGFRNRRILHENCPSLLRLLSQNHTDCVNNRHLLLSSGGYWEIPDQGAGRFGV